MRARNGMAEKKRVIIQMHAIPPASVFGRHSYLSIADIKTNTIMENNSKYSPLWRWIALMAVLANIVFNYVIDVISVSGKSMRELTDQYPSLFTPAGYAFSIWGLIYLAQLTYVVVQVLPSQRQVSLYDYLAKPLTLSSMLGILWLFSFTSEMIGVSLLFIVAMLATSVYMMVIAKREVNAGHVSPWTEVPFSTYAGWLSVATIANTALFLVSIGWEGSPLSPSLWAAMMVGVATMVGVVVGLQLRDYIFPLVIGWGLFAIWIARQSDDQTVALAALVGSLALGTAAFFLAFRNYLRLGNTTTLSPPIA